MKKILFVCLVFTLAAAIAVAEDEKPIEEEKPTEAEPVVPPEMPPKPEQPDEKEILSSTSASPPPTAAAATSPPPTAAAAASPPPTAAAPGALPQAWPAVPGGFGGFNYPGGFGDPRFFGAPGGGSAGAGIPPNGFGNRVGFNGAANGGPPFGLRGFTGYGGPPGFPGNFGPPNPAASGEGKIAAGTLEGVSGSPAGAADVDDGVNKPPNDIPPGPPGFGGFPGVGGFGYGGPGVGFAGPGFYPGGFRSYIDPSEANGKNATDAPQEGAFSGPPGGVLIRGAPFLTGYGRGVILRPQFLYGP